MSALFLLCAACTSEHAIELSPKTYQAHGKSWTYRQTEIHTQNALLASLHVGGNGHREIHSIEDGRGERIMVQDRLYALQKNGRYKKVSCCEYFREQGELYNFDGQLVMVFDNARRFITDCFIYPAGHPDNERKPQEQQIFGTTVYAIFDPARRAFFIKEFDAGKFSDEEHRAVDRSIEAAAHFRYRHRAPFECDK